MKISFIKRILAASLCCAVLVPSFHSKAEAEAPYFALDEEWEVLNLTNKERAARGLEALSVFSGLDSAAALRAEEIKTLFSHTRPDGSSCYTALSGISYSAAGENIAYGYQTPADVVAGWMNSSGHRANILNESYKHLGVGYLSGSWTQMFIGGCATTSVSLSSSQKELLLSLGDDIADMGLMLEVSCNMHGVTYLPLENAEYTCGADTVGNCELNITYDGVTATFPVFVSFSDVKSTDWHYGYVRETWEKGLLLGMTATEFEPDKSMSRAMLVTVIYRLEGSPKVNFDHPFTDVPEGEWYSDAVAWAAENGIVNGVAPDRFDPDGEVTREMTAAILHRYASGKNSANETHGDITSYADGGDISEYAVGSMEWAVGAGLINGIEDRRLDPRGSASRAQIAAILVRYTKQIAENGETSTVGTAQPETFGKK